MRTLLLFDGLGGTNDTLIAALRELYARSGDAAYFHTVFTVLDDIWRYIGNETRAAVLPTELSPKQWLDSDFPATALRNSIVAGICVHVALSLVRGHQLDEAQVVSPELVSRYLARDAKARTPSPMAALTGMSRHDLSQAVRAHGELSVGLINSPTVQVLSGSTADLLDFYFTHEDVFTRERVSWAFLSNSIPFHSSRLAPAARRVRDGLGLIGPMPGAEALQVSVYPPTARRVTRPSALTLTRCARRLPSPAKLLPGREI